MAWYDSILPTLEALAPAIATSLGGPLAGMGVKALENVLGVSGSDAVQKAVLNMDPETAAKVRAADQAFAAHMKELDIDLVKIAAADRDSARKMEVDTKSWTPPVLAALIVGGYIAVQWFLLTHVVAPEMREIVMRSLGMLDAALGLVLGFYFGSSSSSRAKDDTIQALSK